MTTGELLLELEDIITRICKLRLRNKNTKWFCGMLHAAEKTLRAAHSIVADSIKP